MAEANLRENSLSQSDFLEFAIDGEIYGIGNFDLLLQLFFEQIILAP